jgi:hypothetical protein
MALVLIWGAPTWVRVLSKTATFGWLFNARIKIPEQSNLNMIKKIYPTLFDTENKGGVSPVTTEQFPTKFDPEGRSPNSFV